MRTLLVHEWLARTGGSENVFEQMRRAFPSARSACLWNDDPERFAGVEQTWLAKTPLRRRKAAALPFMSLAWNGVELRDVGRVLVSSHAFAHHLASRAASRGIPSFCYVHSPARYIWVPDLDARGQRVAARLGRGLFQAVDRSKSSRVISYAANSRFVADRVRQAWGVDSRVIYPPVDVEGIKAETAKPSLTDDEWVQLESLPAEFILGASRFVPYKRLEIPIFVGELTGLPVVLAGDGPDAPRIRALANDSSVPVNFLGRVSDAMLRALYARAALYVFMPVEDFGIMPVEAIASGTPVLVNRVGGAAESVNLLMGGATANPESVEDLRHGADLALRVYMEPAVAAADRFSLSSFRAQLHEWAGPD